HPVVVVCGETGSGKSTQLPKLCLAAGRGIDGFIGHTQPRRIAARSVATRIAEELGSPLGKAVGYKVRFRDETSAATYVKLMTDGILLAEAQSDPLFERYDTIIIDEAHERSLNIDLLLGLLRRTVERRPGFRLVITSATIDADRFSRFYNIGGAPSPVIEVSGRGHPVDVRYQPPDRPDGAPPGGDDTPRRVAIALDGLLAERLSDVLVFLPTERDIRETTRLLRGRFAARGVEVTPLYARLSAKEQQRVFKPSGKPRVVLATNVAESSLTVPGIRSVVDTGTARIARYAARSRVQRLPIEAISQASADQRAGRCGRLGPGVCVRLYSEDDYESRAPYTAPEVRRTNLAGVVLRLLALRQGDLEALPLLDRPRPEALREARRTLRELQAIDDEGKLTPLGESVGKMPVDPRVGRMIVAADAEGCLAEVLVIAAALETQDPRERPAEKQEAAEASHQRFADARSDFLSYLKLWDHLRLMRGDLSGNQFRRACTRQFLSVPKVLEWEDVHRQLLAMVGQHGLKVGPRRDGYGAIHRSLLAGLLSSIALRRGDDGYQSPSGEGFRMWPGSGLRGTQPKWVVAAETVETSQRFLRTAARVRPEWLPRLASHLIKKDYAGAHWSYKQQTVLADERQKLFDLTLPGRRAIPYGPINPGAARVVFLREALVDEGLRGGWDFFEHNRNAVEALRKIDAKLRRDVPLVDDNTLFEFYNERVPGDVYDARGFRRWYRRESGGQDDPLRLHDEALAAPPPELDAQAFPDALDLGTGELPLRYRHGRGTGVSGGEAEGVTLVVPLELVPTLDAARLDWAVPGLLRDRVIGLIRQLPKPLRTRLVPAPDVADRVCSELDFGAGNFRETIAGRLSHHAQTEIATADLRLDALPAHLGINVRVENAHGGVVAESRSLASLREALGLDPAPRSRFIDHPVWRTPPSTDWSFDPLPKAFEVSHASGRFLAYPGLIDEGDGVAPRLFVDQSEAEASTRRGVRRLFLLRYADELLTHVDWLPEIGRVLDDLRRWERLRDYRYEVAELLAFRVVDPIPATPRDADAFEELAAACKPRVPIAIQEITKPVLGSLGTLAEARGWLASTPLGPESDVAIDIREQLAALTAPGFLIDTPPGRLPHFPRYLRAVAARLRRIAEGGQSQDRKMHARVAPHAHRLAELDASESGDVVPEERERLRWMIEEYRVSVFAQQLGAAERVSDKRLEEQWRRCRRA
ncbi:MAG: ATP-dependent RNA helicase HrpA, partial [Planctomycetota bacterium]